MREKGGIIPLTNILGKDINKLMINVTIHYSLQHLRFLICAMEEIDRYLVRLVKKRCTREKDLEK